MTTPTTPPPDAVVVTREHEEQIRELLATGGFLRSSIDWVTPRLALALATTEHRTRLACAGEETRLVERIREIADDALGLQPVDADPVTLVEALEADMHRFRIDASRLERRLSEARGELAELKTSTLTLDESMRLHAQVAEAARATALTEAERAVVDAAVLWASEPELRGGERELSDAVEALAIARLEAGSRE